MYGSNEAGLTDEEVLMHVMIKNLDTGQYISLKDAEKVLPKGTMRSEERREWRAATDDDVVLLLCFVFVIFL